MSQDAIKKSLLAAIENIKSNPAAANVVFRASTELGEGMHCVGRVRKFAELSIDEPPVLGGTDRGPNPVEIVLVALGTCQEIIYPAYASVMDIELESVKCDLRGYIDLRGIFGLDANVPAGFQKITFETKVKSSASPEALSKLAQIVERHCPVLNTLQAPVEVVGTVLINDRPMALAPSA